MFECVRVFTSKLSQAARGPLYTASLICSAHVLDLDVWLVSLHRSRAVTCEQCTQSIHQETVIVAKSVHARNSAIPFDNRQLYLTRKDLTMFQEKGALTVGMILVLTSIHSIRAYEDYQDCPCTYVGSTQAGTVGHGWSCSSELYYLATSKMWWITLYESINNKLSHWDRNQ